MKLYQDADKIIANHVREVSLPEELTPLLNQLTNPRRGWVKRQVNEDGSVENAQQHVAKLVQAADIIDPQKWGITNIRLRTQALVHELPEVLGTDWMPGEISEKAKHNQERSNLEDLLPPHFPQRAKIIRTWLDYEKDQGLAYFLDKMDAVVTAEYYALANPAHLETANEFFAYGYEKIKDQNLKNVLDELRRITRSKQNSTNNREPAQKLTPTEVFPTYFNLLKNCFEIAPAHK